MTTPNISSSASSQRGHILKGLTTTSFTTLEVRQRLNVLHPAIRTMELRKQGLDAQTVRVHELPEKGKPHRVARYILSGEGKPQEIKEVVYVPSKKEKI
jgi:hypothetical protein